MLRIRAGQFALIDRYRSLDDILPVPATADTTDLIDAVPGAALFWPPIHVLREIGGRALDLPPLPAGHGDYRLRFHAGEAGCLLQIWPQPRGKARTGV